ncbi:MAG: adenylate/guanylate cyclase domain-containing protein [Bacteroidota bacterium]|nr:adenylate/guanylate cyclase domain-containing protein [Bacteroidota bacterium]
MSELEIKNIIGKKLEHYKNKLKIKDMQLSALLDITNSVNHSFDIDSVLEKYKAFVQNELAIEKLILYCNIEKWTCLLSYGLGEGELEAIDIERDLFVLKEITSVNQSQDAALKKFDMVVPVFQGEKALAYLVLGDLDNETLNISNIIKHLNFLQLVTNIVVSALENQQLTKKLIKEEQDKRQLIEEQNMVLEKLVEVRTRQLKTEKEESERLLNNILPKGIADELKEKGYTTPAGYKSASILFTDFKEFTEISSRISPNQLVSELNDIFRNFDFIMEKYGLEKIKTIGDAYMAADGLPEETNGHAVQCIRAGLAMLGYLEHRNKTHIMKWEMRVGVNTGPLIAGVVGTRKFTYDIWGDTVNIAARMESNSETGMINITSSTHELVAPYFECENRGSHFVKGKGDTEMYFIQSEKESERLKKLKAIVLTRLEKELTESLHYHGVHHTIDVMDAAFTIAIKENIPLPEIEILLTGALMHDTGFLFHYDNNEDKACEYAKNILPDFGYTAEEIEKIVGIITATKVPQRPATILEMIICDADLDYLGRSDYSKISYALFRELNENGHPLSQEQWVILQEKFLKQHKYFTLSAKRLRKSGKYKLLEIFSNNL